MHSFVHYFIFVTMENPFDNDNYSDQADSDLISDALNGSKASLEILISRHQPFIYNVAWKMVLNPQNAEDITQDILIKVITKLSQFDNRSQFRTWLYRIVVNHVLNCKKQFRELQFTDFETVGRVIDSLPDNNFSEAEQAQFADATEDVRVSCTAGMLLCLDREQRITFILGGIFNIDHKLGAEILEISPDNFRQRLSRARRDLYSFMENKCGLINKSNPCRCPKKTKAFIDNGWTFPDNLQFNTRHIADIYKSVPEKNEQLLDVVEEKYKTLFLSHPLQQPLNANQVVEELLHDSRVRSIFDLN
jgi:RNA polymerase sigma factor (sigma-70 family)